MNIPGTWERNLTILLPDRPLRPHKEAPRKGVYVAGFGQYVKIGISVDVYRRAVSLQTPEALEVYAVLDGWSRQERELHRLQRLSSAPSSAMIGDHSSRNRVDQEP